jgi:SIR2-like domain
MSTDNNALTPWLLEQLQNGQCVLFLGAGAVMDSVGLSGSHPLTGTQLRDKLADKFLGGKHKDKPLPRVAEFAKYESSLPDVQTYIRDLFLTLQPNDSHKLIPLFRWHAIITTNYDLVIERAYESVGAQQQQQLRPIIRDGDNFSSTLKDQTALPYLKLHGCINTVNDERLPLILGSEEYAKHRANRTRLFDHFKDWAREKPVIFAGYDISDPNIQQILFDLTNRDVERPIFAVVDPNIDDIAGRYWAAHRFVPLRITFAQFMSDVNRTIPLNNRVLASLRGVSATSISSWFPTKVLPSSNVVQYLTEELQHVSPSMARLGVAAKDFFSGNTLEWSVFHQELDFKRRSYEDLILDLVIGERKMFGPRIALVRGHAGAGKSVVLRRFAWDAVKDFGARVLALKEGGVLRPNLVLEIAELAQSQIFLVIDDALQHIDDLTHLRREATKRQLPIEIVIAARTNEWNQLSTDNDLQADEVYEVKQLNESEIQALLNKLRQHSALGELAKMTEIEQTEFFRSHVDRQLMVALHEATSGKPFEEMAFDEYEHVQPREARLLYLDICTLHRLGISVRAGLVSRVSGITFDTFKSRLFSPLEHVVHSYFDAASRDYVYRSRHPLIAEFVFERALPSPIERAAQITRMIRHMDTDYESDSIAFSKLISGRVLADLFADKSLVRQIFDAALESGAAADHVQQQIAIFELNHPNGSMPWAYKAIKKAENLATSRSRTIEHTKANVLRRLALETDNKLERDRYRSDAKAILKRQQSNARASHAFDTYARVLIDELNEFFASSAIASQSYANDLGIRSLADLIREAEECISTGLQKFPADEHLLLCDAQLATTLADEPRALDSLEFAFKAGPGRPFIACRLARTYRAKKNYDASISALTTCLGFSPSSKECHLELAKT